MEECITEKTVFNKTQTIVEKYQLSKRETEVLILCSTGLTNPEIAKKLFIQLETVKFHMKNIFFKTGTKKRAEVILMFFLQDEMDS